MVGDVMSDKFRVSKVVCPAGLVNLIGALDEIEDGYIENTINIADDIWLVTLATRFRPNADRLRAFQNSSSTAFRVQQTPRPDR